MEWFISDTHFNHDLEFIYGPRKFNSVKDMNDTIISNWNNKVGNYDDVYVLGDFFLGPDIDFVYDTLLKKLNGNIYLIRGNHDTNEKVEIYKTISKIKEITWAKEIEYGKRKFFLSHYPTYTAELTSDPNTCIFNLHGHTHSKSKFFEDRPYMYNVACDAHNNSPVSINEIMKDIDDKISECISFLV